MYFKPRDSALYSFVAQLSFFKRYMIAGGIVALFVWLWLFFIYMPIGAAVDRYATDCHGLHTQCSEYVCARKQCSSLQQEVDILHTEFDICAGDCGATNSSLCVAALMNHVQESGIQINSCSIQEKNKNTWYDEQIIALHGQGTLQQLLNFFEKVGQNEKQFFYTDYSLTQAGKDDYLFACSYSFRSIMKKPFNLEQAEGLGG